MGEVAWIVGLLIALAAGLLIGVAWGFGKGEKAEEQRAGERLREMSQRFIKAEVALKIKLRDKGVDLVALGIDPPPPLEDRSSGVLYNVSSYSVAGEYQPPDPYKEIRSRLPGEKC